MGTGITYPELLLKPFEYVFGGGLSEDIGGIFEGPDMQIQQPPPLEPLAVKDRQADLDRLAKQRRSLESRRRSRRSLRIEPPAGGLANTGAGLRII